MTEPRNIQASLMTTKNEDMNLVHVVREGGTDGSVRGWMGVCGELRNNYNKNTLLKVS